MFQPELTAEIVTFRAAQGVTAIRMADAAQGLGPFLTRCEGFVSRTLSCDENGIWTDHVVWTSHEKARAAAESVMAEPCAAAMMALVDPASICMVHAPILVMQKAA